MSVQVVAMIAGLAVEASAWRLVAKGRGSVWAVMTPTLVVMGTLAIVVRTPVLATEVSLPNAAAIGIGSGIALYAATRAFVAVVSGWRRFQRAVDVVYRPADQIPLGTALSLSMLIAAGEELFWRGLFQPRLAQAGAVSAAAVTWLAFVAANLPSESLPIVAGAIVGGAVWAGLALATGGLLASLLCHAVWTALMLALPPGGRGRVQG